MTKTTVDRGFDFIRVVKREHGEEIAYAVFCAVQEILPKEWGSRVLFRRISYIPDPECLQMTDGGPKKINVIKAMRAHTGMGLKEAKDIFERAQKNGAEDFGHGLSEDQLEAFINELQSLGATVELLD